MVPGEVIASAGEPVAFEAWSFDDKGRFLRKEKATWSVDGLAGEISADGRLTSRRAATTAGKVKADGGRAVRDHAGAPLRRAALELRLRAGRGAAPLDRRRPALQGGRPGRRQAAAEAAAGGGPAARRRSSSARQACRGYTIESDLLFTRQGRRAGDVGLINQGYTLDLMGKKQELQLRTWASELEKSATLPFPSEPDVWYRMKLRVDAQGDKGTVRGKVWKKDAAGARRLDHHARGSAAGARRASPGLYGDSVTDLYWDNLTVRVNE